jgi:hypothetical protein
VASGSSKGKEGSKGKGKKAKGGEGGGKKKGKGKGPGRPRKRKGACMHVCCGVLTREIHPNLIIIFTHIIHPQNTADDDDGSIPEAVHYEPVSGAMDAFVSHNAAAAASSAGAGGAGMCFCVR